MLTITSERFLAIGSGRIEVYLNCRSVIYDWSYITPPHELPQDKSHQLFH